MEISMENKFKGLAKEIKHTLREVHIHCHTRMGNKYHNSIYLGINKIVDPYAGIRLSDHQGKLTTRYNLRSDITQSEKIQYKGKTFFMYSLNDIKGLLMRVMKEANTLKGEVYVHDK